MLYQLAQDVELQDTQQHDGATARVQTPHVVIHTKVKAWLSPTTRQWSMRHMVHGFGILQVLLI